MPPPILEAILKVGSLPSRTMVAVQVLDLIDDPESTPEQFADILSIDPALTGRILGYVNSSAFSLPKTVYSIAEAVRLIGLRALKVLSLSFSLVDVLRQEQEAFDYEDYWRHAFASAAAARLIAREVARAQEDEAFVGGLLMDIGIMAAATAAREEYEPVLLEWKARGFRDEAVELEKVGVTHPAMSAALLRSWKLPEPICAAIGARGGAEDGLDETTKRLARILRAASRVGAIFSEELLAGGIDEEKGRIMEWTGIGEPALEEVLEGVSEKAGELSASLTIDLVRFRSYADIREEAARKLTELGLQAEQESAAMKQSVEVAGQRQRGLLRSRPPEVKGCAIGLVYLPSERVGGDFYDFVELPRGRVGIFVGDCTGHGIEAAVIMGVAQKSVRSGLRQAVDVGAGLRAANRDLHPDMTQGTFATVFACVYEPGTRTVRFARGGHPPALLLRASGGWSELAGNGMGLGLDAGPRFDKALVPGSVKLGSGDLLLLHTDGISEAMGPGGEEYGEERMKAVAAKHLDGDPQRLAEAIAADVAAFRGAAPQEDDITLIALRIS